MQIRGLSQTKPFTFTFWVMVKYQEFTFISFLPKVNNIDDVTEEILITSNMKKLHIFFIICIEFSGTEYLNPF